MKNKYPKHRAKRQYPPYCKCPSYNYMPNGDKDYPGCLVCGRPTHPKYRH